MRCLLVSTFEQQGGAARSAQRLHRSLCHRGVDSRMLVQYKGGDDPLVAGPKGRLARLMARLRPYLDALPLLCYRSRLSPPWSLAWLPWHIRRDVLACEPDLVHIHNVGHGFLSLAAISCLPGPLVWTLHDSWAFTGGCHLPSSCERYRADCGRCPQLNARHEHDLSRWGWQRKSACWEGLDVTFVSPSNWLAERARSSSLLGAMPIEVIPNGIDTALFAPGDRKAARDALGLPRNGTILLFGAAAFTWDGNKGFALLQEALAAGREHLKRQGVTLALFGDNGFRESELQGVAVRSFGPVTADEQLRTLYCAADLFILPSLQENLPNTLMEAMACGVPCVAFAVGGVGDLVEHAENGCLARPGDAHELAKWITWSMADELRRLGLGRMARRKIEKDFSLDGVTDRYLNLYRRVINKKVRWSSGLVAGR